MVAIFNFFGSLLGYLLWWLYLLFRNYGVAIIFFSMITKAVMFPFTLKQQKSMAAQGKLSEKQKELQQKYGKNQQKYSEELSKLYEKEGVNPTSGCLTSLLPMPLMFGIFYSVVNPLSNTLHIAADTVKNATDFIQKIPGMVSTGAYPELAVLRNYTALSSQLDPIFAKGDPAYVDKLQSLSGGFNFLGLDLLSTPSSSPFSSMLWIIPLLSLLVSFGTSFYTQYTNKKNGIGQQTQQGCMKAMMYVLPLFSVYLAYTMPAAVGFYWIMSGVVGLLQIVVQNKYFSVHHMTAKSEGQREAALILSEEKIKPLSVSAQKQIAEKIEAQNQAKSLSNSKKKAMGDEKKSVKKVTGKSSDQYRGSKK